MSSRTYDNDEDRTNNNGNISVHPVTPLKAKNGAGGQTSNNMKKRKFEGHNVDDDHTKKKKKNTADDSIRPDDVVSMVNSFPRIHYGDDEDEEEEEDDEEEEYKEVPGGQYPTYIQLDHILNKLGSSSRRKGGSDDLVVLGKLDSLLVLVTNATIDDSDTAVSFVKDYMDRGGPFRMIMFLRRNMKDPARVSRAAEICSACLDLRRTNDCSRLAIDSIFVDRDSLRIFILAIEEEVGHRNDNDWLEARRSLWSALLQHVLHLSRKPGIEFEERIQIVAEAVTDYLRLNRGEWQADVLRDVVKILCVLLRS